MKTRKQIESEIERLKVIEAEGITNKCDTIAHAHRSPHEAAIFHYWETVAQRIKLEWVLKDDLFVIHTSK